MSRFLRPTGEVAPDGYFDAYDVYENGELAGTVFRNTDRNISGRVEGFKYRACNGDTHLFAIATPTEAAKQMLATQAAGGAAAVQYAYERANGWSTD